MKAPSLADFGLNDNLYKLHESQLTDYNKRLADYAEKAISLRNRICIAVAVVVAVIAVIVAIFTGFIYFLAVLLPGGLLLLILSNTALYDIREPQRQALRQSIVDAKLEARIQAYLHAVKEYETYSLWITRRYWIDLDPYEFERAVAALYRKFGYDARATKGSGDGGVDVELYINTNHIAVQCKHHQSAVGPRVVRDLQSVVLAKNYSYGIVVSLNGFTDAAKTAASFNNPYARIKLLELSDLIAHVELAFSGKQLPSDYAPPRPETRRDEPPYNKERGKNAPEETKNGAHGLYGSEPMGYRPTPSNPFQKSRKNTVELHSEVHVFDNSQNCECRYIIDTQSKVNFEDENSPPHIAYNSPLGIALMHRFVGDTVTVSIENSTLDRIDSYSVKILNIINPQS